MTVENDLFTLARKINESTDALTNDLKNSEKQLLQLKLGFSAWAPTPIIQEPCISHNEDGEPFDCVRLIYLGWAKGTNNWCFQLREEIHEIVEADEIGYPIETKVVETFYTNLMESDRTKRFAAFEQMDALEKQIAIEGHKILKKIETIRTKRKAKALEEPNQMVSEAGF